MIPPLPAPESPRQPRRAEHTTDRVHLHPDTNMTYGEQVVNKGFLLLKEKDPQP